MGERHKGTKIYRDLDHDRDRDRNSLRNETTDPASPKPCFATLRRSRGYGRTGFTDEHGFK